MPSSAQSRVSALLRRLHFQSRLSFAFLAERAQ